MKFRVIEGLAAAVIVIVAVFSVVMLNLQWLPCQEPACVIEPSTQAVFGAVLFAGALVSATVLIGAAIIARAVLSAAERSVTQAESAEKGAGQERGGAAV